MTDTLSTYRLRATMRPMQGQPVNWNARAIMWSGSDHRYWLRRAVTRIHGVIRNTGHAGVVKVTDRRYRTAMWLFGCIDDRDRIYTRSVQRARRLLNTQADVDARKAWAETNRYWRSIERRKVTA